MKKLLSIIAVGLVAGVSAYAQGSVNFANIVSTDLNQPIFHSDGTTRLSGATFQAELLAGTSAGSLTSLGTTGFLTAGGAGYFSAGSRVVSGVAIGQSAFIQIQAWNTAAGATFALAQASGFGDAWGHSGIFQVVTTGAPNPSATLLGLQSFSLNPTPEPSTLALAGLGAAALLFFRRRK